MRGVAFASVVHLGWAILQPTVEVGDVDAWHDKYTWMVVVGICAAFFMAWGIGANDVANSFASSVGSKALTLKQAVCIATVMEFVGCLAMGAAVTDTVRKGIIDASYFEENPELLQTGMLASLLGAGFWLALCSYLGSPVSTTHSIIGSLIGVSLTTNPESLNTATVGLTVLSWLTSPLFSGIIAAVIFSSVRALILRKEDAVSRTEKFFPFLLFFTFSVFSLYTTFKNPQVDLKEWRTDNAGAAVGVAFGAAAVLTGIVYVATIGHIRKAVAAVEEEKPAAQAEAAEAGSAEEVVEKKGGAESPSPAGHMLNRDLHAESMDADGVRAMHDDAEKFPAKTEKFFTYLQVVSAAFDSLAHGANDVANSVGPLAAIWGIHEAGEINSKVDVPLWVLVLGGVGISSGLIMYGYNVIMAIGIKLAKITPSRGFSIEMGSSIVVIIGSNLGIPLSTTHCQVGATVGVGMCEARGLSTATKGVNWKLMGKVVVMWVATLAFAGICSASLYGFLASTYHPISEKLHCGPISKHIEQVENIESTNADAMSTLFKELDTDGDEELTDGELAAVKLDMTIGGDLTTEKFGRRRRRTPDTMTSDDFLTFTCVKENRLDHMLNTHCEPVCQSGYRADGELKCGINSDREDENGNFLLTTRYSGFTECTKLD
mmetsp:Transcript_1510/g.3256  ORF Transcript_1510/g.3256 Transcript_1510/m.3256 type:complete len:659 (-) Transcript_1510:114-2090(-)